MHGVTYNARMRMVLQVPERNAFMTAEGFTVAEE